MDFDIPADIQQTLDELDQFIEDEIKPLERQDDNIRFFDHRREDSRTDWERNGWPNHDWEVLLGEMRKRAANAGFLYYGLPERFGGSGGTNLGMAIIREHLATRGLGLHNDLQNESSIVGNFPTVLMMEEFGSEDQQNYWIPKMLEGTARIGFGLTEPMAGTDATRMHTTAYRDGDEWVINGAKRWNTGMHAASHDYVFARTSGNPGEANGITCFIVPVDTPGFTVEFMWWTYNMPTDHAEVSIENVRVSDADILGTEGKGLDTAQLFVHENRIRQAASSLGAAQYCINEAVKYSRERMIRDRALSANQAIQWPLVELHTEAAMLRELIRKTAWQLDQVDAGVEISDKVAMCNYRANRLVGQAADRAIQVHGGIGYSRHMPFEHIFRHHRRYRITEGAEEMQMRRVGQYLFGFGVTNEMFETPSFAARFNSPQKGEPASWLD
ncbi:MAG: acyl-CoA dehydrogenase family protein [Actinomycetia bacterium]|nr:acyl-CoA dehydrogenase family protein [Actinomycetes bacterium]